MIVVFSPSPESLLSRSDRKANYPTYYTSPAFLRVQYQEDEAHLYFTFGLNQGPRSELIYSLAFC